ncbi:hypothetical protein ABIA99_004275 [Bradyrhizobium sp. LB12.1]|uniref:hypothetical protein n=1 Tax=Bradyrhizobium sp. LB12.1 TaxID=3156327 RepID=UPI00339194CD
MIPIEQFDAEIRCGREWTPCTVHGVVGDDETPRFLVSFEDDDGMTTLLCVSDVRRRQPSDAPSD